MKTNACYLSIYLYLIGFIYFLLFSFLFFLFCKNKKCTSVTYLQLLTKIIWQFRLKKINLIFFHCHNKSSRSKPLLCLWSSNHMLPAGKLQSTLLMLDILHTTRITWFKVFLSSLLYLIFLILFYKIRHHCICLMFNPWYFGRAITWKFFKYYHV